MSFQRFVIFYRTRKCWIWNTFFLLTKIFLFSSNIFLVRSSKTIKFIKYIKILVNPSFLILHINSHQKLKVLLKILSSTQCIESFIKIKIIFKSRWIQFNVCCKLTHYSMQFHIISFHLWHLQSAQKAMKCGNSIP